FLRPILNRLKQIDGRAPVSIFCNRLDAQNPQLQAWLNEGLSLEVHTLTHPCPLLANSNFVAAASEYHDCVDLLNRIPGNKPVAFRMPCCDGLNTPTPRFYAELFNRVSAGGRFLTMDSSILNLTTTNDNSLPSELAIDADGREKFRKYFPTDTNFFKYKSLTLKFVNFHEAEQRLYQNLTAGQPLRDVNGQDNGVRLVDLNNDGFLDVVIANDQVRKTRVWRPSDKMWIETDFPTPIVSLANSGSHQDAGVRFGIVGDSNQPVVLARSESQSGAWRFDGEKWILDSALLNGLVIDGQPLFTAQGGYDRGARLRDVDGDGVAKLIIANESQNAVFAW